MFYIRKLTKTTPVSILREATATELHNYKNRFVIKPPVDEPESEPEINPGCDCTHHTSCFDELSFININCDLDLDNLGSK